tara:strand:- start:90 stop:419 length:330 start_codon:yes stop_codon:yes gene_type:complete
MFENHLTHIEYPTPDQKAQQRWDVSGIIKGRNQRFKFDTRPLRKIHNIIGKKINTKSRAEKMVFETKDTFIVADLQELNTHMRAHNIVVIRLKEVVNSLNWNIILPKTD